MFNSLHLINLLLDVVERVILMICCEFLYLPSFLLIFGLFFVGLTGNLYNLDF